MTGLSGEELGNLQEPLLPDCLARWKAPKICPACLKEESWCRKAWDALPFTACLLHRIVLIDLGAALLERRSSDVKIMF